jgi:hypothetical protein
MAAEKKTGAMVIMTGPELVKFSLSIHPLFESGSETLTDLQ